MVEKILFINGLVYILLSQVIYPQKRERAQFSSLRKHENTGHGGALLSLQHVLKALTDVNERFW